MCDNNASHNDKQENGKQEERNPLENENFTPSIPTIETFSKNPTKERDNQEKDDNH